MPDSEQGAQRASARKLRSALIGVFAALVIVTAMSATAPPAQAASQKVVIVVGPVGSATADYKHGARKLADKARSYGARVVEIFSPYATWSRVHDAAQGANILIYLGHGNGWPSPYRPFMDTSKDGMGLNASSGHGNSNTKYYGEYYMERLGLASHAVVVLNRLCYASGNNEWGAGNPTLKTAKKRVDNYGYGFIKGGAQAVFASGITDVGLRPQGPVHGLEGDVDVGPVLDRPDPDRPLQDQLRLAADQRGVGAHGPVQGAPLLPIRRRTAQHDGGGLAERLIANGPGGTTRTAPVSVPAPSRFPLGRLRRAAIRRARRRRSAPRPARRGTGTRRRPPRAARPRRRPRTPRGSR